MLSSRAVLETSGKFAAYEALLSPAHRETLREVIAGTWVDLTLAEAHYAACEALQLTSRDQVEMGRKTGERVNGTLLGTIVRLAHQAGATPWTVIEQLPRFWQRGFDGGSITYEKLGPKEARVVIKDQPLMRHGYFRNGLAGTAEVQLKAFCTQAYVRVDNVAAKTLVTTYRYQWA